MNDYYSCLKSVLSGLGLCFASVCMMSVCVFASTHVVQANDLGSDSTFATAELTDDLSAQDILQGVVDAVDTTNFEMSLFVFRPGNEPVPYIWRRGRLAEQSVEYLNELNGPGTQVVRFGNTVSYLQSDAPSYTLEQGFLRGVFPHNVLHNPAAFAQAYDIIYVGRARVTGRNAYQLRIVSKDKSRYSYALWVAEEHFLPLKLSTFTLEGELLELVQVTHVNVTEHPHASFAQIDTSILPPLQATPARQDVPLQWTISKLPVGMTEVQQRVTRLAITGELVEHMMLSDGLVDISVYLQPADDNAMEDVVLRNRSDTLLTRTNDGIQISVVGKIPAQTANTITQFIRTKVSAQ